jgi:hypothetical protein
VVAAVALDMLVAVALVVYCRGRLLLLLGRLLLL